MSRTIRTLSAMRSSPVGWRIHDLEKIARAVGVTVRKPRGSHVVFTHPQMRELLTVPAKRPIKPIYVRRFVAWVEAIMLTEDDSGSADHR